MIKIKNLINLMLTYVSKFIEYHILSRYRPLVLCKFSKNGCYVMTRRRVNGEPICGCCQDPSCSYDPELRALRP